MIGLTHTPLPVAMIKTFIQTNQPCILLMAVLISLKIVGKIKETSGKSFWQKGQKID